MYLYHWRSAQYKCVFSRRNRDGGEHCGNADGRDQFCEWQDAMAADQPQGLHAKGREGREVDQAEQAQKQERDEIVARRPVVPAPQKQADAIEGRTVRGDEGINQFRDGRESGKLSIKG